MEAKRKVKKFMNTTPGKTVATDQERLEAFLEISGYDLNIIEQINKIPDKSDDFENFQQFIFTMLLRKYFQKGSSTAENIKQKPSN